MRNIFKVGGCIRDKFLGLNTKDIDFTFVCEKSTTVDDGWNEMKQWLSDNGFKTFLETKSCFTIRAKFPVGHTYEGLVADFVMARKEVGYIEGTRRPILEIGTLEDDLVRRDFTVNAMAEDIDGNLIDPHDGLSDLSNRVLITPTDPMITMLDDPLRVLRALRFSITKGFTISSSLHNAMIQKEVMDKLVNVVSGERIREELEKMFKFDTVESFKLLNEFSTETNGRFLNILFGNRMRLTPTFKTK